MKAWTYFKNEFSKGYRQGRCRHEIAKAVEHRVRCCTCEKDLGPVPTAEGSVEGASGKPTDLIALPPITQPFGGFTVHAKDA